MASSEPHPVPNLPLSQKGDSDHWPQQWRPECDCCLEHYKSCSRKDWQGARGVVYRRHPQCPRISLLSSPCTLVKTLQEGREGFITPCFTNKATEFGGAACYSPRVGPLPPQEPRALPPALLSLERPQPSCAPGERWDGTGE